MSYVSRNWRGLLVFVMGIGTIAVAHYVLKDCADEGRFMTLASGMKVPMKCHWTELASYGTGALVAIMGLIMLWQQASSQAMSLAVAAAGALIIATPVWLIGTCPDPTEPCNTSLKPGLILIGALMIVVGIAGAIRSRRLGGNATA